MVWGEIFPQGGERLTLCGYFLDELPMKRRGGEASSRGEGDAFMGSPVVAEGRGGVVCFWVGVKLEFTSAGLATDSTINGNFAARPRLTKSEDWASSATICYLLFLNVSQVHPSSIHLWKRQKFLLSLKS